MVDIGDLKSPEGKTSCGFESHSRYQNKQAQDIPVLVYFVLYTVPGRGLEPPCLATPAPKAGVSTNFTTPALYT